MKKIGMRTIKTGIAVFLAALAGYFGIVETPVYTVSVCIFSIKNTVKSSIKDSLSRIIGTLLGGFIGYLFALATNGEIFIVTIGVVLLIHICHSLKLSEAAGVASVTFAAIIIGGGHNSPLTYSIGRTIDTLVGVLIALIVNYGLSREKYLNYLCIEFNLALVDCAILISNIIEKNSFTSYDELKERFDNLKLYYSQILDETTYLKKNVNLKYVHHFYFTCEELMYHVQGLYIISTKSNLNQDMQENILYKYHKQNIHIILTQIWDMKLNLKLLINKKRDKL